MTGKPGVDYEDRNVRVEQVMVPTHGEFVGPRLDMYKKGYLFDKRISADTFENGIGEIKVTYKGDTPILDVQQHVGE